MRFLRRFVAPVLFAGAVAAVGCGGDKSSAPTVTQNSLATQKLEAMRQIATACERTPSNPDVAGYVDELTLTTLDYASFPTEMKEILSLYRQKVQGKVRGEIGMKIQTEITAIEQALRKGGQS